MQVYKYRGDCVVHLKRKHQKTDMIAHSYVDRFDLDTLPVAHICAFLKPKQPADEADSEANKVSRLATLPCTTRST